METRDVIAAALAAVGVTGAAIATSFITTAFGVPGGAWWGVLLAFIAFVVAGVLLFANEPDTIPIYEEVPAEPETPGTVRLAATALGVPLEESRQAIVPKVGHAIGQAPDYYEALSAAEARR